MGNTLDDPSEPPDSVSIKNFSEFPKTSINSTNDLVRELSKKNIFLSEKEIEDINKVIEKYPMRINPHFFSLIKEKNDSIWNQCVPNIKEIEDERGEEDPLNEENEIPCLTHRYPDRALLLVSNTCAMYCRFCTRKRKVGEIRKNPSKKDIDRAINYIKNHSEIRDVIISGGDPLLLSDKKIEEILISLRKISHIEMIRIGTRVPCVMPSRITDSLCEIFRKNNKRPSLYINTHFENPAEITEESRIACEKLIDSGVQLGNQSVILKNINYEPEIFKKLNQRLLSIGVKPYYIYQPDPVKGTFHFIGPVEKGLEIIKAIRGHTSGMAVPHFVIDAPGGGGKIPLLPEYAKIQENGNVKMINYKNKEYFYNGSEDQ
ncbi:MAG: KamA family radical SAM protein [Candidatus Pacearchaeota archaeon]